jgi:hypothetical protein
MIKPLLQRVTGNIKDTLWRQLSDSPECVIECKVAFHEANNTGRIPPEHNTPFHPP